MKPQLFYRKKPILGLDIGSQSAKFVQCKASKSGIIIKAYGSTLLEAGAQKNGVLQNVPELAGQIYSLLTKHAIGGPNTNRIAMSVPISRVFTRILSLPVMSKKEMDETVRSDVEQSVPMPIKDLYYDYETMPTANPDNLLVRIEAAPKVIIDSYESLCELVGLDLCLIQTNVRADARLCMLTENIAGGSPYIIVVVGNDSIDIGVLDPTLRVTGIVEDGGDSMTAAISQKLRVTKEDARNIKVAEGIQAGAHQNQMMEAVSPVLSKVVAEIEKVGRFYHDRVRSDATIAQILIAGDGANMPGLSDYLTDATHMPARVVFPWGRQIGFGKLSQPEAADLPQYLTATGLALASFTEAVGL